MIPAEVIKRKRNGEPIPEAELRTFIEQYTNGSLPDAQMAALLMAIYFNGMTKDEIFTLTKIMIESGEQLDFSHLDCYVADKHSTGGVGDKVSLILGPLMAATGLAIPMLSGRSLGHTGGTLDKLETLPGYRTDLSTREFRNIVETVGIAMIGQTADICPADRKMYALRDVTGTVESIPLICGSIMSKKIAEGIQGLVLDVKIGNGAFMKTLEEGKKLGTMLQQVGEAFGVRTDVVYSSMNQPLGRTAGLWCEVAESIEALKGNLAVDLKQVTFTLGARLLMQANRARNEQEAFDLQQKYIDSGEAMNKFIEMVEAHGGNGQDVEAYQQLHAPRHERILKSPATGYVQAMDTYAIGMAAVELGCGRKQVNDILDPTAGMEFLLKIGDPVRAGEPIIRCFNGDKTKLDSALQRLVQAITIGPESVTQPLFLG
jgi:pyrimidine-nucleoside phosphorylase